MSGTSAPIASLPTPTTLTVPISHDCNYSASPDRAGPDNPVKAPLNSGGIANVCSPSQAITRMSARVPPVIPSNPPTGTPPVTATNCKIMCPKGPRCVRPLTLTVALQPALSSATCITSQFIGVTNCSSTERGRTDQVSLPPMDVIRVCAMATATNSRAGTLHITTQAIGTSQNTLIDQHEVVKTDGVNRRQTPIKTITLHTTPASILHSTIMPIGNANNPNATHSSLGGNLALAGDLVGKIDSSTIRSHKSIADKNDHNSGVATGTTMPTASVAALSTIHCNLGLHKNEEIP